MNTEPIAEFIQLTQEKRQLATDAKKVQEALDALEPSIIAAMQADGVQSVKVDGMLAYLSQRVWAKMEFIDSEKVADVWPSLLTINHTKAGALLNELLARGEERELAELAMLGITPNTITKLNIKKG